MVEALVNLQLVGHKMNRTALTKLEPITSAINLLPRPKQLIDQLKAHEVILVHVHAEKAALRLTPAADHLKGLKMLAMNLSSHAHIKPATDQDKASLSRDYP